MKHIIFALSLITVLSFIPKDRSYTVTQTYNQQQWALQLDSLNMAEYYIGRPMFVNEADILKAFIERKKNEIIEQINKQVKDSVSGTSAPIHK